MVTVAFVCRRLMLTIVDHAVVARIEMQTSRLSLYDIEAMRSNGPRRKPKSESELLAACHERLHGPSCQINSCTGAWKGEKQKQWLRSFLSARRSSQRASARSSDAAAMQRSAHIRFRFAQGCCEFEEEDGQMLPPPANYCNVRLCLQGHTAAATQQSNPVSS